MTHNSQSRTRRAAVFFNIAAVFVAQLALPGRISAQTSVFASDDAGNYQVSANWTNGSNRGFGFTPWVFATNVFASGFRGFYLNNGYAIASVTNVSGTNYTNCSWGIYANGAAPAGGNRTVAYRGFAASNALTTNVVFKLQWMSEGVGSANTNRAGFVLRAGNPTNGVADLETAARFEYYYAGGGADSYLVVDGRGTNALGIPFYSGYGNSAAAHAGATGMNCEFTLEPNDTYRFVVRSATNGAILASLDGQPLAGAPGSAINSVALYANETTGGGSSGGDQNFNRLQIVSPALLAPAIVNVQPANNAYFVNPGGLNVSFEVDSFATNLAGTNVSLTLNGVAQTLAFNTAAGTQTLLATNTAPLASNTWYNAVISASDGLGNTASYSFSFNTYAAALFYDVYNYHAAGNGVSNDTAAIQMAINACAPGGFVWLHDGTFLSGTIYLKDNMSLYIDTSATLLGSGSQSDYPVLNPPTSNNQKVNCDRALVYAESRTNVTVMGGGTINGNGRNNFTTGVENTRPISVWTACCNQVMIRDLTVVDSAMWTIVNMESDNLTVSNVTVNSNLPNERDGCDVVDCWHVNIVNCTINSGDDSICMKSGNAAKGLNDVHVSHCTITQSGSNGLKFGTASTGPFSNVTFSNCVVQNTAHSAMAVESVDGGVVSGILFQGITFTGCQNAFFIVLGTRSGATVGSVNGVTFQDITGSAMTDTRGSPIVGEMTNSMDYKLKNIVFNNVNVSYKGGVSSVPGTPAEYGGQYPENTVWGNLPAYGYYVRHASGVTFTNCHTTAASADARPWLATSDVTNLSLYGPALNWSAIGANLVLQWSNGYILQSATNVAGPYASLNGITSPYTNALPTAAQRYFRLSQ